jgi:hypothetical protein
MWFGVALAAVALLYLVVRGPRAADATADEALGYDAYVAPAAVPAAID